MRISAYAKHDIVIVQPIESEEKTSGRIVLSDNGKEKANQYKIVSVGPGIFSPFTGQFNATQWTVGETVFVHKVHLKAIEVDGEEFFIVRDMEILCGIKEEEDAATTA